MGAEFDPDAVDDLHPDHIGKFRVVRFLGQGAMGTVYLAHDEDLDRNIAIKLLRNRDVADSAGQIRMRREAQALARLSHNNVVHVYEVGEHNGDIYIAMEFIEGVTARTWLGERPRRWEEILAIYLAAGNGLVAAHDAGLTHRDFKPDNVLVRSDGQVKVVDFGLARLGEGAMESPDTPGARRSAPRSGSEVTQAGTIIGTPAYMAPEQRIGALADARSDQFSFCVALFEALHGSRPFRGTSEQTVRDEMKRGLGPLPGDGRRVPARLHQVLKRGLAFDPASRYPSMHALLGELQTHARKSRMWLWVALTGFAAVTVSTVSWLALDRSQVCKDAPQQLVQVWDPDRERALGDTFAASPLAYAADMLERTAPELDTYAERWAVAYTQTCLDHQHGSISAEQLDRRMRCLRTRRDELDALVDVLIDGSAQAIENASGAARALTPIDQCTDPTSDSRLDAPSPAIEADAQLLGHDLARIKAEYDAGLYDSGLLLAETAVTQAQVLDYKPLLAEALGYHGMFLSQKGRFAEAEAALGEAVAVADSHGDDRLRAEFLATLVFVIGERQGRPAEALRVARMAEGALVRMGGDPAIEAWLLVAEGNLLRLQGENLTARARLERALELAEKLPGDAARVLALSELGNVAIALDEYPVAGRYLEQALALTRQELGPGHPKLVYLGNNLASLYLLDGRPDLAEKALKEALTIAEVSLGADHPTLATVLDSLGLVRVQLGDHEGGTVLFERARAILESGLGPLHASLMPVTLDLIEAQIALAATPEAITGMDRAIAIWEANSRDTVHDDYLVQLILRFAPQLPTAESERARRYLDVALTISRAHRSVPNTISTLAALARREHAAGLVGQARRHLDEATELSVTADAEVDPLALGGARLALAGGWWLLGERERGLGLVGSIALPDVGAEELKAAVAAWLEVARAGRDPPP